jgi:hypothetical protein
LTSIRNPGDAGVTGLVGGEVCASDKQADSRSSGAIRQAAVIEGAIVAHAQAPPNPSARYTTFSAFPQPYVVMMAFAGSFQQEHLCNWA